MSKKKDADLEKAGASGCVVRDPGFEYPDPTPVACPIKFSRPPTIHEQIKAMIRSERLAQAVREGGGETFEEADDFEVGDDYDPTSPYEEDFEGSARLEQDLAALKTPPSQPVPGDVGGDSSGKSAPVEGNAQ